MTNSLEKFATSKLAALDAQDLRRSLVETDRHDAPWIERNGRRLLSFSCNDYLNLTGNPAVKEAAIDAIRRYGVGAGASRLVTGNHPLLGQLEARLARMMETEAACVFGSGYLANTGIVPALAGPDDLILIDELAHGCLWGGARLAKSTVLPFRHNDLAHVEQLLAEHRTAHTHALILTDGVFSQDGDLAPLEELFALSQRFDTWLMSDDAHGIGAVGQGRGATFATGKNVPVPLKMGTLGKAVGSYGAYLCASKAVVEIVRNRARTFGLTTGLPPATVAASIAALDIIAGTPGLTKQPLANARLFARHLDLPEPETAIVPFVIGGDAAVMTASQLLIEEGFFVPAIRYPAVPKGTARLRIIFTAAHTTADIERFARVIRARILPLVAPEWRHRSLALGPAHP